ncbi:hypothetical protein CANARDRAFT_28643 [[Candida] arabinofermentans NRRL YB-2248]|uniref:DUF2423 domain-containing protein n=1 Tax=[Candida] arabinofermentans NRRL YB-2248 TaxID=983967 RepID=A0A1E4SZL5_9ASCO|nr:hypothetical protein CANARDRAFT_28643 [[Candida] arabinofermentans NRRL YB-2248]
MAHSARSKSKLKAKAAKISGKNSDYLKLNEARRNRLADKLKENLIKQKQAKGELATDVDGDAVDVAAEDKMDDDSASKVSTAGWRSSRHNQYKKNHATKKSKKNKTMKF